MIKPSGSNKKYAEWMRDNENEKEWSLFAGRCLLSGIKQNQSIEHILEYIFETYHNFSLEEIPISVDDIDEDMNMYFANRYEDS